MRARRWIDSLCVLTAVAALAACASLPPPASPPVVPGTRRVLNLESDDPYFAQVRDLIRRQWGYPCVQNYATRRCEYQTTDLTLEFTILEFGDLHTVAVVQSSGYEAYDRYATEAVRRAAPFPPVPPHLLMGKVSYRGALLVRARFSYVVEQPVPR